MKLPRIVPTRQRQRSTKVSGTIYLSQILLGLLYAPNTFGPYRTPIDYRLIQQKGRQSQNSGV